MSNTIKITNSKGETSEYLKVAAVPLPEDGKVLVGIPSNKEDVEYTVTTRKAGGADVDGMLFVWDRQSKKVNRKVNGKMREVSITIGTVRVGKRGKAAGWVLLEKVEKKKSASAPVQPSLLLGSNDSTDSDEE